jgi:hypothetical protein
MRARTVKVLLFVVVLSVFAADISVGCGQGYVYGPVTQKYNTPNENFLISINGTAYAVPQDFYYKVKVGDTVKFDGKTWTIVKAATPTF